MSMAIRERFRELALLRRFGFRRRELFAFILAESFALALYISWAQAGGVFYHVVNIEKLSRGILVYFSDTEDHGPGVSGVVGRRHCGQHFPVAGCRAHERRGRVEDAGLIWASATEAGWSEYRSALPRGPGRGFLSARRLDPTGRSPGGRTGMSRSFKPVRPRGPAGCS